MLGESSRSGVSTPETQNVKLDSPASHSAEDSSIPHSGDTGWSRFSGLHTRTFEMELLLSGAVVFALVQLPPIVNQHLARFRAGLVGDVRLMGMYAEVYVTLVLYALIGAFVGPVGVVQTIVAASLAGLLFGIGWAVLRRGLDTPFGFGPMLALGALVTVLWPVPLGWLASLS